MSTSRLFGFAALVAAVGAAQTANAVVLDFQSLAAPGTFLTNVADGYTEDGFKFLNTTLPNLADSFGSWQNSSTAFAGSTTLFNQWQDAITQLSRVGGGAFDVSTIDLASLNLSPLPNTVTFTGTRGDNSTVVNAITMSNPSALLTYNFTGMTNIVKLEWSQSFPFHQFDNINVNSVPEPATMSALALGVLAFARRRRLSA